MKQQDRSDVQAYQGPEIPPNLFENFAVDEIQFVRPVWHLVLHKDTVGLSL